jgi:hypothetical protein
VNIVDGLRCWSGNGSGAAAAANAENSICGASNAVVTVGYVIATVAAGACITPILAAGPRLFHRAMCLATTVAFVMLGMYDSIRTDVSPTGKVQSSSNCSGIWFPGMAEFSWLHRDCRTSVPIGWL